MDKSLIVLGASGGLAETVLAGAAQAGFAIVLHGRRGAVLKERAAALPVATQCVEGDAADPDLMDQLWSAAMALGQPFGLVSCLGVAGRLPEPEWTAQGLAHLFGVNSAAPLLLAHRWAQRMLAAGYEGNAVLLSTMQAMYPFEGSFAYALSKSGLELGIQILAKDHGPAVRINGVAPGVNEAGMALESIGKGKYKGYLDRKTIPRYGQANDVARTVMFLLQTDLYLTGQTLLLDGGLTLRRDMAPV